MKEGKMIPELRFPEFEGEWEQTPAGDLFSNSRQRGHDDLPVFSVTQSKGLVRRDSLDRKMANDASPDKNLFIGKGYLAYNMMRMWQGAVGLAFADGMVSPAYIVLKPNPQTSSVFFINHFQRSRSLYSLWAYSYGLTNDRLRLYYRDFSKISFIVPSLPEQQKIASFLSAIDKKIEQLTRKKELLEQYKKGVMQKLFSQEIRFKDDNGQDYPDWEEKKLGDITQKINNKNKDGSLNLVLTNSATQGIVNQQDYFDKNIANQDNLVGYYVVELDDFIYNPRISSSAPVGPIKRNRLCQGVMSPLYTVFRFIDSSKVDFFEHFFETTNWHKYMHSIANYGARHDRMNIISSDFQKMPVPMPCDSEMKKICLFLLNLVKKLNRVERQLNQTQTFKKGLLQKMFV